MEQKTVKSISKIEPYICEQTSSYKVEIWYYIKMIFSHPPRYSIVVEVYISV